MKPPILNHVALSVPRRLVSDTPERRKLLDFYESVFGWRAIDIMGVEGERLVLHLHQVTHFLYLEGRDNVVAAHPDDHFGIEVYERETLTALVERAKTFQTQHDSTVEITPVTQEDYGPIRIFNTYIRYLLPLKVEVQYYEGVEAHVEEI